MDKVAKMEFVATNSKGARISLRSKAEMEVRWQDMLEDLKELKHDKYVIVSQHKDSSLRCACWQGLIYLKDTDGTDVTLKDWHEWNNTENHITPKQKGTLPDGQPYYSLREAMECGLFSYNCRHRLIKYEAGVKVPKQYAYNPNEESKSSLIDQHMRQMEQNIRRAKERQTLALSAKERAKWQEKSKALQKKYDEFCKKNNRVRNDWRTVIGRQERRGMKAVEQAFDEAYIDPKASAKEAAKVNIQLQKKVPDNVNEKELEFGKIPSYVEVSVNYRSREYKDKLKELNYSYRQTKQVYKGIKRIFNNKASREKEGLYMIDLKDLSKSVYSKNGKSQQVTRTKEIKSYIENHPDANIVTIHNHRGDNVPSIADIAANRYKNSHQLIVVGNRGSIFYMNVDPNKPGLVDNLIEINYDEEYNKVTGEKKINLLKQFCKKNNIVFKILRKEDDLNE